MVSQIRGGYTAGSVGRKMSRGLGDTIAKITEATGIDKLVKRFVKGDCGCNKRREQLNKLVPYGSKDANPPDDTTGG